MVVSALWGLSEPPINPRETNYLSVGIKRFGAGKYILSYRSIRRALALNPSNLKARELKQFLQLVGIPKSGQRLNDPLGLYNRLRLSYPNSPYLKMVGAELMLNRDDADQAEALLLSAAADKPNFSHIWYILGIAQRALGKKEEAIKSILKAIDIEPQQRYYAALGECYFFTANWVLAKDNFRVAFQKKKWELSSKVGYLRSLVYIGEYALAVSFAKKLENVITTSAKFPQKEHNKTKLLIDQSKYKIITDLTREQFIEYIQTIARVAERLSRGEVVDSGHILKSSDTSIQPALQFDFTQI